MYLPQSPIQATPISMGVTHLLKHSQSAKDHPLKKYDAPCTSSHQLSMGTQLEEVSVPPPYPLHTWFFMSKEWATVLIPYFYFLFVYSFKRLFPPQVLGQWKLWVIFSISVIFQFFKASIFQLCLTD